MIQKNDSLANWLVYKAKNIEYRHHPSETLKKLTFNPKALVVSEQDNMFITQSSKTLYTQHYFLYLTLLLKLFVVEPFNFVVSFGHFFH